MKGTCVMDSVIKSGQKDTEASICRTFVGGDQSNSPFDLFKMFTMVSCVGHFPKVR